VEIPENKTFTAEVIGGKSGIPDLRGEHEPAEPVLPVP
jgi:hypothetical protein